MVDVTAAAIDSMCAGRSSPERMAVIDARVTFVVAPVAFIAARVKTITQHDVSVLRAGKSRPERMATLSTHGKWSTLGVTSLLCAAVDLLRSGDSRPTRLMTPRISMETIDRGATKTPRSPTFVHRLANAVVDAAIVFSHAWVVPKQSKTQKARRDEGIIAGLRKYFAKSAVLYLAGKAYTRDEVIALFEEHLRALSELNDLTIRRSVAVESERTIEAGILPVRNAVKSLIGSQFTLSSPQLREFGLEPDKKPRMTAETKRIANEKRQATRKERGIVGRRQRHRPKGT